MNLNALHTFLAILETGSLVRAADQLNVTQSTVTARLKALELELGQTLIHRQKSGATVTAAGQRLIRHAETITGLWHQARQETALPGAFDAVCNIACHPDLWPDLGTVLFEWIKDHHPNVALSIWQGGQSDISTWMNSGLADIALTYWPSTQAHHSNQALTTDTLSLFASSPNRPIRFDPDYVFVDGGDVFGRAHAATYANANTARISFGSATLGLAHLQRNGGSAYLPNRLARHTDLYMLDAPRFTRDSFVTLNTNAAGTWAWLADALAALR